MDLHPSVERPRTRALAYVIVGGSLALGAVMLFDRDAPPAPTPSLTKIEVAPPAVVAPPVVVPIHVPAPAPALAPEPAPIVEPEPVKPRATSPFLHARCVDRYDDSADDPCAWDDGFPAISHDGKTIVAKSIPDDGGRGYPGLSIVFLDAATGKATSTTKILDPDEFDPETDKHRAKVEKRVEKLQRTLDARGFRALRAVAIESSTHEPYAETIDDTIRIIVGSPAGHGGDRVLWTKRYLASAQYPNMKYDPETDMCGTVETSSITAWWDAETRTIVTTVGYAFGPSCMCGGDSVTYVHRLR